MFRFAVAPLILFASCVAGSSAILAQSSEAPSSVQQSSVVKTPVAQSPDDAGAAAPAPKTDVFYSGSVVESTSTSLIVSKTVLGKKELRTFTVTADTKVEGRLRIGARVTVRYAPGDSGDSAILIVVRSGGAPAKKK